MITSGCDFETINLLYVLVPLRKQWSIILLLLPTARQVPVLPHLTLLF